MLIKLYSTTGDLHIIEGVTDVSVPLNISENDYKNYRIFDLDVDSASEGKCEMGIIYAKDGICMLRVWNIAYICSDNGKTIEKVVNDTNHPK